MEITFSKYRIHLRHTFGISRGSNNWYDSIFIYIRDGEIIGRGEAAPSKRYGETVQKILTVLNKKIILPANSSDRKALWHYIKPQLKGIKALEAAFSVAIWDWWGQKQRQPVYKLLGVNNDNLPKTSFTIAIGNIEDIGPKIEEAEPYQILKVKLGTEKMDKDIISEIRMHTDKLIRVDANEGWDESIALELVKWLADQNVEFIEQPFPSNQLTKTANLRKKSPLKIYADENSLVSNDIPIISKVFDGINIKLMKCGSLEEAQRMIKLAKYYDMKIMLGCMVESSVGITAAAQLSGDVDAVDLDGNLLIKNDPYSGVNIEDGRIVLNKGIGLGLSLNSDYSDII